MYVFWYTMSILLSLLRKITQTISLLCKVVQNIFLMKNYLAVQGSTNSIFFKQVYLNIFFVSIFLLCNIKFISLLRKVSTTFSLLCKVVQILFLLIKIIRKFRWLFVFCNVEHTIFSCLHGMVWSS